MNDRNYNMIMNTLFGVNTASGYPFYDVIKHSDSKYELNLALAGFKKEEIRIDLQNSELTIYSVIEPKPVQVYVRRGIATRDFERKFTLPEYAKVTSASYNDGILSIIIDIVIPEDEKVKQIKIN